MHILLINMVEERKYLYSLCSRTLRIDKSIKFTSVVNSDGKLIVGKSRHCRINKNVNQDFNFFRPKPKQLSNILSNGNNSTYSIPNKKNTLIHSKLVIRSAFQFINVNNGGYIAFVSLTENQDKYLCIYFEPYNPLYYILLKLNTVFECVE